MYRRILIATDGSELAGKGLDHGLDLARAVGAHVVVVTVTEPWMPAFDDALALSADPDMQREYREGCERSAQRILADAAAQAAAAGVACTTVHVPDGHPSDAIVHAAAEHGADLVVMASHGRRGLGKVLLGSQTEAVLARSKVPVLVCAERVAFRPRRQGARAGSPRRWRSSRCRRPAPRAARPGRRTCARAGCPG